VKIVSVYEGSLVVNYEIEVPEEEESDDAASGDSSNTNTAAKALEALKEK
jgi:hypothetical protein